MQWFGLGDQVTVKRRQSVGGRVTLRRREDYDSGSHRPKPHLFSLPCYTHQCYKMYLAINSEGGKSVNAERDQT